MKIKGVQCVQDSSGVEIKDTDFNDSGLLLSSSIEIAGLDAS